MKNMTLPGLDTAKTMFKQSEAMLLGTSFSPIWPYLQNSNNGNNSRNSSNSNCKNVIVLIIVNSIVRMVIAMIKKKTLNPKP